MRHAKDAGADSGAIVVQRPIAIAPTDHAADLYAKVATVDGEDLGFEKLRPTEAERGGGLGPAEEFGHGPFVAIVGEINRRIGAFGEIGERCESQLAGGCYSVTTPINLTSDRSSRRPRRRPLRRQRARSFRRLAKIEEALEKNSIERKRFQDRRDAKRSVATPVRRFPSRCNRPKRGRDRSPDRSRDRIDARVAIDDGRRMKSAPLPLANVDCRHSERGRLDQIA